MSKPYKAHVFFDEDTSLYLQSLADKSKWSVSYIANHLVRMMKEMEITTDVTLKTDTLPGKDDAPPVKFKPRFKMSLKK